MMGWDSAYPGANPEANHRNLDLPIRECPSLTSPPFRRLSVLANLDGQPPCIVSRTC